MRIEAPRYAGIVQRIAGDIESGSLSGSKYALGFGDFDD